jgi:hypothetical protein
MRNASSIGTPLRISVAMFREKRETLRWTTSPRISGRRNARRERICRKVPVAIVGQPIAGNQESASS